MFVIDNEEDCEKLKKCEETKGDFMKKKLKENQSKQNFSHDLPKFFESSIDQQEKTAEGLTKSLTTKNEKIDNTNLKGLEMMEYFKEGNENLTKLINSNITRASFVKVLADLKIPKKVLKKIPEKNQVSFNSL